MPALLLPNDLSMRIDHTVLRPDATKQEVLRLCAVAGQAKVKASGGIRTLSAAVALLKAGAGRLGTNAGVAIIEEWQVSTAKSIR